MGVPTVKIVADVAPSVAWTLSQIAEQQGVSKRAVLECAIEKYADILGVTVKAAP